MPWTKSQNAQQQRSRPTDDHASFAVIPFQTGMPKKQFLNP